MDLNDISKDIGSIPMPQRRKERQPDLNVRNGKLKAAAMMASAFMLLIVVAAFGFLVVTHFNSPIMTLMVIVYLAVGIYLALKLWTLKYTGWLYMLYLVAAVALLSALTLITRGISDQAIAVYSISALIVSLAWAAVLWWAKDLFGIKKYREIFEPYK